MTAVHVAYVLLHFPCLTETFVSEEIRSVQRAGVNIHLYSLLPAKDKIIHPVSQQLLSLTRYVPNLYHPSLIFAQAYYLFKAPAKYLGLLKTILAWPSPRTSFLLKRLVIFFKGVWLAKQLEHTPVQLVHTHFAWLSTVAGIVISQLLDIPFTVTAHAYDIYSEENDLLTLACHFAERIVTISEINRATILKMNPDLSPVKVEVLRCGIDLDFFHPLSERSDNKTIQITSVGSLLGKKGHEYLIRACSLLQSQKVDFQCVIVGRGGLEQSLKNLIHEMGLGNKVILAGAHTQEWIRDRLSNSDLFVLACVTDGTGDQDGIPVSMMEAMAMAVPVISTPVSGVPELVHNLETGLLVPERNVDGIAEAIRHLAENKFLRETITRNGLDLVHTEYDIAKNADRLSHLFGCVIGKKSRWTGGQA